MTSVVNVNIFQSKKKHSVLNNFHNLNIFPIVDIIPTRQIETIAFGESLLQLLQTLPTLFEEWVVIMGSRMSMEYGIGFGE